MWALEGEGVAGTGEAADGWPGSWQFACRQSSATQQAGALLLCVAKRLRQQH